MVMAAMKSFSLLFKEAVLFRIQYNHLREFRVSNWPNARVSRIFTFTLNSINKELSDEYSHSRACCVLNRPNARVSHIFQESIFQ